MKRRGKKTKKHTYKRQRTYRRRRQRVKRPGTYKKKKTRRRTRQSGGTRHPSKPRNTTPEARRAARIQPIDTRDPKSWGAQMSRAHVDTPKERAAEKVLTKNLQQDANREIDRLAQEKVDAAAQQKAREAEHAARFFARTDEDREKDRLAFRKKMADAKAEADAATFAAKADKEAAAAKVA